MFARPGSIRVLIKPRYVVVPCGSNRYYLTNWSRTLISAKLLSSSICPSRLEPSWLFESFRFFGREGPTYYSEVLNLTPAQARTARQECVESKSLVSSACVRLWPFFEGFCSCWCVCVCVCVCVRACATGQVPPHAAPRHKPDLQICVPQLQDELCSFRVWGSLLDLARNPLLVRVVERTSLVYGECVSDSASSGQTCPVTEFHAPGRNGVSLLSMRRLFTVSGFVLAAACLLPVQAPSS